MGVTAVSIQASLSTGLHLPEVNDVIVYTLDPSPWPCNQENPLETRGTKKGQVIECRTDQ